MESICLKKLVLQLSTNNGFFKVVFFLPSTKCNIRCRYDAKNEEIKICP